MTRRFHYRDFNLSLPEDAEAYEAIMQAAIVDRPQDFTIVSEAGTWTKAGEHMLALAYTEDDHEDGERY